MDKEIELKNNKINILENLAQSEFVVFKVKMIYAVLVNINIEKLF
jgi:hypothetical protein